MRNKDSVKQISIEYNDSNTSFTFKKKVEKQPLKQQKKTNLLPVFVHSVE